MTLDSLEKLEDAELRAIITRADQLLKQHDTERKDKAMNEARTLLASVGLSLKDLGKSKGKPAKAPFYRSGQMYQHPTNKGLLWNARGQKPNWLRELEASGGNAIEVKAANDTGPGRKAG